MKDLQKRRLDRKVMQFAYQSRAVYPACKLTRASMERLAARGKLEKLKTGAYRLADT